MELCSVAFRWNLLAYVAYRCSHCTPSLLRCACVGAHFRKFRVRWPAAPAIVALSMFVDEQCLFVGAARVVALLAFFSLFCKNLHTAWQTCSKRPSRCVLQCAASALTASLASQISGSPNRFVARRLEFRVRWEEQPVGGAASARAR